MTEPLTDAPAAEPWIPSDKDFASRLAAVRHRMRWNVKEAARECGFPAATWRLWEEGATPRNIVTIGVAISTRTGCDLDWLIFGPNKPLIYHGEPARRLNVDYPIRLDPLAARIVKPTGANGEVTHGDGRRRGKSNGRRPTNRVGNRTVSPANQPARISRGTAA